MTTTKIIEPDANDQQPTGKAMTQYWALRIDRDSRQFFVDEVSKGRLREGWGFRSNQDLRSIQADLGAGRELDDNQKATWRRCRRMLSSESDGIQFADLIIVPHLHKYGTWSILRVTGSYDFVIPECGDYGHILPVEYATELKIDPYAGEVSAELRQSMKNQLPLWSLSRHGSIIEAIVKAANTGSLSQAPSETERLQDSLDALSDLLWEKLRHHYQASEFELPCQRLLERIFGTANVDRRAGRAERGADFICTHTDPLGTTHNIAVQVKMWDGGVEWQRPLRQIREAYASYESVTSGIILTTATHGEPEFEKAQVELENELGIPVRMICREELLRLFIRHLPELAAFEDAAN